MKKILILISLVTATSSFAATITCKAHLSKLDTETEEMKELKSECHSLKLNEVGVADLIATVDAFEKEGISYNYRAVVANGKITSLSIEDEVERISNGVNGIKTESINLYSYNQKKSLLDVKCEIEN